MNALINNYINNSKNDNLNTDQNNNDNASGNISNNHDAHTRLQNLYYFSFISYVAMSIFKYIFIIVGIILVIIIAKFKQKESLTDQYKPINWKDATTIGQPIDYGNQQKIVHAINCGYGLPIKKLEMEFDEDQTCRSNFDSELAKKNPRKPLVNQGAAFVHNLINDESFEDGHYSSEITDNENRVPITNKMRLTPRSAVNLYR